MLPKLLEQECSHCDDIYKLYENVFKKINNLIEESATTVNINILLYF